MPSVLILFFLFILSIRPALSEVEGLILSKKPFLATAAPPPAAVKIL